MSPGDENVPPGMKRCTNCQELVPKKIFIDVHLPQCGRTCKNCGESMSNTVWKEHYNACGKCRYCDQYSTDWKAHTKTCAKKLIRCDLCKGDMPREDLEAHTQTCRDQRRRQNCNFCNGAVLDISKHVKTCTQAPTKNCRQCNAKVNKFVFGDHLKIYCTAAEASGKAASAAQAGTETANDPEGRRADLGHKGTS